MQEEVMVSIKSHPILEAFHGSLDDLVFRRRNGRLEVYYKPVFHNRVWSEAQLKQQERFRQAMAYVQQVKADPQALAAYQKRARRKKVSATRLMMKDYFSSHSPK
jgi:hypothetical protein